MGKENWCLRVGGEWDKLVVGVRVNPMDNSL